MSVRASVLTQQMPFRHKSISIWLIKTIISTTTDLHVLKHICMCKTQRHDAVVDLVPPVGFFHRFSCPAGENHAADGLKCMHKSDAFKPEYTV